MPIRVYGSLPAKSPAAFQQTSTPLQTCSELLRRTIASEENPKYGESYWVKTPTLDMMAIAELEYS